jgi:nucleoside-diphosphate-sugar epimerase
MKGSCVALTGATGFIGRHVLRALSEKGYRVRVLLRRPSVLPVDCASAVIGDLARPQNMAAALAGVDAVIHSAGISEAASGLPEDDHRALNAEATVALARASLRAGIRRFIFLSSIRAQSGPTAAAVLTEESSPCPTDAFGRSKLAAEQGLAQVDLDWVALRLTLVYGPGVQGNMARLIHLARSPLPLPFAGLVARRSLLSLGNLVSAIECVLAVPGPLRRPLIVADRDPLSVAGMVTAMRRGLGRRPGLFPLAPRLLGTALKAAGHPQFLDRLASPLVANTAALARLGWTAPHTSAAGLERLMRDRS